MTNDELRVAIEYFNRCKTTDKEFIEKIRVLIQLAEGVLRLPEEEYHYATENGSRYETEEDKGWNAYREEARKVIGLE